MKKKLYRMLCLLLSMCVIFGLLPAVAFADDLETVVTADEKAPVEQLSGTPKFTAMLNVGDSIASACGINSYVAAAEGQGALVLDSTVPYPGSYAQLVSDALGVDCFNAGRSAWRSKDFLFAMSDDGQGVNGGDGMPDAAQTDPEIGLYSSFYSQTDNGALIAKAQELRQQIELERNDLIVVNFGANDIFSYTLAQVVTGAMADMDMSALSALGDPGSLRSLEELIAAFVGIMGLVKDVPALIGTVLETVNSAVAQFAVNYPATIRYIREKNPDAKIVCLSIDNPIRLGFNMPDGSIIELYTLIDAYAWAANDVILRAANSVDNCQYVDVSGAACPGILSVDMTQVDFSVLNESEEIDMATIMTEIPGMMDFLKAVHPNDAGHAYIARRIIEALERDNGRPELTADRNSLGQSVIKWAPIQGAYGYRVYRSTTKDGGYRLLAQTALPGIVDLSAAPNKVYYYRAVALMNLTGTIRSGASDAVHVHQTKPVDSGDGSTHTLLCEACGEAVGAKAHSFDRLVPAEAYLKSAATCTKSAVYYKSCACGAVGKASFSVGLPLGHSFGAWTSDNAKTHSRSCVHDGCVEKQTVIHSMVNGKCVVCGYVDQALLNAKAAAKAALKERAGEKQSAAMKLIVRNGELAIDAAGSVSAVALAKSAALNAIDARLRLEKPVTVIKNVLGKLFR